MIARYGKELTTTDLINLIRVTLEEYITNNECRPTNFELMEIVVIRLNEIYGIKFEFVTDNLLKDILIWCEELNGGF